MEFWGVEVKPGQTVKCEPGGKLLHLSQASLGELKDKRTENVPVFVNFNDQKLLLGTLSTEKCAQIAYDLVFEREFELSHSSKNASVYFCGFKYVEQCDHSDDDSYDFESDSDEDVQIGENANGKPKVKDEKDKSGTGKANAGKEDNSAAKPKAKIAEPIKAAKLMANDEDNEEDSEEETDDEVCELMVEAMGDSDDEDEDTSSEEDEATPKKIESGKKRPAESASKTPVPEKKAKVITPVGQKTGGDGKKGGHIATPYPVKKVGKTPADSDKAKKQTPKSGGSVTCESCSKSFNSDSSLQAHTKAKHSGAK